MRLVLPADGTIDSTVITGVLDDPFLDELLAAIIKPLDSDAPPGCIH